MLEMFLTILLFFLTTKHASSSMNVTSSVDERTDDFSLQENFGRLHLLVLRRRDGGYRKIVHFAKSATNIQPVCFNTKCINATRLENVAYQLCRKQGFQTFRSSQLVHYKLLTVGGQRTISAWNTSYSQLQEETCQKDRLDLECTHMLQIECGVCQFSYTVREDESLHLRSPLYPDLPPGLNCVYDVSSHKKIEVMIENLNLDPEIQNSLDTRVGESGGNCLDSFLQIQTDIKPGKEISGGVYTLCGNMTNKIITTNGKHIRLRLVSGTDSKVSRSGFSIKIGIPHSGKETMEIVLVVSVIMIPLTGFILFFIIYKTNLEKCFSLSGNRRRPHHQHRQARHRNYRHRVWVGQVPRQRVWVSQLPRQGETLHQAGTRRLQRYLESEENSYVLDNRVSNRSTTNQRPLPQVPEETAWNTVASSEETPSHNVTSTDQTPCHNHNITSAPDQNNNEDKVCSASSKDSSDSADIYQTVEDIQENKFGDHPLYLSLISSADGTYQSQPSRNSTFFNGEITRRAESLTSDSKMETSSQSTSQIQRSDETNKSDKTGQHSVTKYSGSKNISLSGENIRTPKSLTPVQPSGEKIAGSVNGWTQTLSTLGSRFASLASYTSITRNTPNKNEELSQLIEDDRCPSFSFSAQDDDVFNEEFDV